MIALYIDALLFIGFGSERLSLWYRMHNLLMALPEPYIYFCKCCLPLIFHIGALSMLIMN